MLVNSEADTNIEHVKFISYTGKYPNLCSGILTLEIDGVEFNFGHNPSAYDFSKKLYRDEDEQYPNYPSFWESGGSCGFTDNYEHSYCNTDEWTINYNHIPQQFQKYAHEIDEVFNDNVEHGCCGGCL